MLQHFHDTLSRDENRACYGFRHVEYANSQLAIDALLISDTLYRAADPTIRQKYKKMMLTVKPEIAPLSNGNNLCVYLSPFLLGI